MGKVKLTKAHEWFQFSGLTCCRQCGIVRNETSDTRACKGAVKVGLRAQEDGNG